MLHKLNITKGFPKVVTELPTGVRVCHFQQGKIEVEYEVVEPFNKPLKK